ncbi:MAG: nucleoside recognition domain-containing protein [Eubacteriales bacterium]
MDLVSYFSMLCVPGFILLVIAAGLKKRVPVFDSFIKGAKGGIGIAFKILPYVVGMVFAVDIFNASGCFGYIAQGLAAIIGPAFPPEILPLALIRPFSGGAAVGILVGIFTISGTDSFAGRVSSTMMGSSETLFYTVSLYYGSIGIKRTRHTIPASLLAEITGTITAVVVCSLMFQ